MKRAVSVFLLFLMVTFSAYSTDIESDKNIGEKSSEYAEWGYGNEFLGAAHFWLFLWTWRFHRDFAVNTGFSYILVPGANYNADFLIFPVSFSYLWGKNGHYLEPQVGFLFNVPAEMGYRTADRSGVRATTTSDWLVPMAAIGYRYQPDTAGWFFRVSMYAYYGRDPKLNEMNFVYWPGISLGRVF